MSSRLSAHSPPHACWQKGHNPLFYLAMQGRALGDDPEDCSVEIMASSSGKEVREISGIFKGPRGLSESCASHVTECTIRYRGSFLLATAVRQGPDR